MVPVGQVQYDENIRAVWGVNQSLYWSKWLNATTGKVNSNGGEKEKGRDEKKGENIKNKLRKYWKKNNKHFLCLPLKLRYHVLPLSKYGEDAMPEPLTLTAV